MGSLCSSKPLVLESEKPKDPDFMIASAYHYDLRKTYTFIKILNHGAFGQVKLFKDKTFKESKFAIKTISKELLTRNKFNRIKTEIDILSQLDHPNIVNYYCTIEMSDNFNILMEYLEGKSFLKLITEYR
jgi:serine/threonine protein kinase